MYRQVQQAVMPPMHKVISSQKGSGHRLGNDVERIQLKDSIFDIKQLTDPDNFRLI